MDSGQVAVETDQNKGLIVNELGTVDLPQFYPVDILSVAKELHGLVVNQVGSSSRLKSVTFYALLFLLWSVAYVRLVPSRFPSRLKLGSRVILLPNAFLLVTAGCFFAFDSDSLTMMLSGVMILFGGNVNLVAVLRSLFGSAPEETDTASE